MVALSIVKKIFSYLRKVIKVLFNRNKPVVSIVKNGWKFGITKLKATKREAIGSPTLEIPIARCAWKEKETHHNV
jgi:phage-related protein